MKIENLSLPFIGNQDKITQKDNKTKILARDVFDALPTLGLEPFTLGALCVGAGAAVMWIGGKIVDRFVSEVGDQIGKDLADYFLPEKVDLFKGNYYMIANYGGKKVGAIEPRVDPIFESKLANEVAKLEMAPKDAIQHGTKLKSAIFSGESGTGKTSALEAIARKSGCNYFILTGDQFINFLDNANISNFFFDYRSNKLPTIFIIEQADRLFDSEDSDAKKAIQQFTAFVNNNEPKLMFLFATEVPLNRIENKAFLNRMDYKISVQKPGPNELKKIIYLHAKNIFRTSFADFFTEEVCERLAKGVFKGHTGRTVEKALCNIGPFTKSMSEADINNSIRYYISNHGSDGN